MSVKNSILNSMPNNLNKLEQARYLYLKLGLIFNFSTKFNNTTSSEYSRMYTEKYDTEKITKNQLICKLWSLLYSELLNEIGIENRIIKFGHEYVMFKYNDEMWMADATTGNCSDLSRIKYGDDTWNFGKVLYQNGWDSKGGIKSNPEELAFIDQIDMKFDFYNERKQNHRKLIEDLNKLKNMNLSLTEKMEYVFCKLGRLHDGYYEAKEYVRRLEYEFLTPDEFVNVGGTELKRTNKDGEVDIVQCLTIEENNNFNYYLLAPNQPVTKVNKEDIIRLAILGYSIDDRKIPGVDFPNKFKPGKISSKPIKYRLFKDKIPKNILPYDEEQIGRIAI